MMKIMIKILYEDNDLAVLDKPSGLVVNRADSVKEETIQDFTEAKILDLKGERDVLNEDFYKRSGVVHRLDKETSGILIIAKNPESFFKLQQQFKDRLIKKEYVALVHGRVFPKTAIINVPVERTPWNRQQFGVLPGGRESVTEYKVEDYYLNNNQQPYTLVNLFPLTGRTHQIRVHLKYMGYPIVSDKKYLGKRQFQKDKIWCGRLFLHAGKIEFCQPISGGKILVESKLPKELFQVMEKLVKKK